MSVFVPLQRIILSTRTYYPPQYSRDPTVLFPKVSRFVDLASRHHPTPSSITAPTTGIERQFAAYIEERANPAHTQPHPASLPNTMQQPFHPPMQMQTPQQQHQQHLLHEQQLRQQQHQQLQQQPSPPAASLIRPPLAPLSVPKQQVATVLNSLTAGGSQLQKIDGYDLANLHAMNARYLQQLASQRGQYQYPGQRQPAPQPQPAQMFAAKM